MNTLRISRCSGFGTKPPQDFAQSPVTLGTASDSTIRFDAAFDRSVAPHHARMEWKRAGWYLLDLGSPEGTWVDGHRLGEALAVSAPMEFSLGEKGPNLRVEILPPTVAAPPVQMPQAAATPRSYRLSGMIFVLIAVGVFSLLTLTAGAWFFWKFQQDRRPSFSNILNGGIVPQSAALELAKNESPAPPRPPSPPSRKGSEASVGEYAFGLKYPSAAEQTYLERNVPSAENIGLNSLAIQRGAKAASNGTLAAAGHPVTFGSEVSSATHKKEGSMAAPKGEDGGLQLPIAIDNSKLPCFPPITSQGRLGSCASFSMTYYAASHNTGHVRNATSGGDSARIFSPKWTYTMVNGGNNDGSLFLPIMNFLQRHGVATLAEWPYNGDPTNPANFREWATTQEMWRSALNHRIKEIGTIRRVDTPGGLQALKSYLSDGYIVTFGTSVGGWKYAKSQANPASSGSEVNADVCYYIRRYPKPTGHAMTVVGYDDNLWVDVNKNGTVDPGETGALKVANSWGTDGWAEFDPGTVDGGSPKGPGVGVGGFVWILYDALKEKSAIPNFAPGDRVPHSEGGGFWQNLVYYVTPYPSDYQPKLLARFTIQSDQRDSIDIRLGISGPGAKKPEVIWRPGALALPQMSEEATSMEDYTGMGGPFGMNGAEGSSKGTFVFDLTDLLNLVGNPKIDKVKFYLMVNKLSPDANLKVENFSVMDPQGKQISAAQGLPTQVNAGMKIFAVNVALPGKTP